MQYHTIDLFCHGICDIDSNDFPIGLSCWWYKNYSLKQSTNASNISEMFTGEEEGPQLLFFFYSSKPFYRDLECMFCDKGDEVVATKSKLWDIPIF